MTLDGAQDHSERRLGRLNDSASGFFTLGTPGQTSIAIPSGAVFATSIHTVPLNLPVLIVLQLDAWSPVYSGGNVTSTTTSDFQNTLTFARTGPVFNLAVGVTANSADFSIVDNRLAAVPESSAGILLGTGIAALAAIRRSRRGLTP